MKTIRSYIFILSLIMPTVTVFTLNDVQPSEEFTIARIEGQKLALSAIWDGTNDEVSSPGNINAIGNFAYEDVHTLGLGGPYKIDFGHKTMGDWNFPNAGFLNVPLISADLSDHPDDRSEYYSKNITRMEVAGTQSNQAVEQTMAATGGITVVSPNGGEIWQTGTTQKIHYTNGSSQVWVGSMNIDLLKGGTFKKSILSEVATAIYHGYCIWKIPSDLAPGNDYKIRIKVQLVAGPKYMDTSDANFSIVTGPIEEPASDEFPIATTMGKEMAFSAAFDGTNYLVGIQGDQNSNHNITAQLVSRSGALVGSRISEGAKGGTPFIAFDGTNYLMIWEEDAPHSTRIYGQFISKAGTVVGSQMTVGVGSDMHLSSNSILFDGTNYFVVWENRLGEHDGDTADVYAQFITPSGTLLGLAIPVSTAAHGQKNPTLAFDGTNILVIWVDGRNQSACYTDPQGPQCYESDIYGQFITKSSNSSAGTLFGTNFVINISTLPRDTPPKVAFDGTNYLVTFLEETTLPNACPISGCKWDIYGQLVTKEGIPISSRITITDTSPNHFPLSGVVFNGTNYLVTWTEGFGTTDATVKGRFFNKSGSPVGSEFTLFSPSGSRVPWSALTLFDGLKYFSVIDRGTPGTDPYNLEIYTNQDVFGAFIHPSAGTVVTPGEGTFGTEVAIIGFNFGTKGKVFIGDIALKVLEWADDFIHAVFQKPMDPGLYDLTIQPEESKGAAQITVPNCFTVKAAEIHSIEQGEGSAYDQVIIKGKFLGTKKGKVYLKYEKDGQVTNKNCKVVSWTMDSVTNNSEIVFLVPKMLPETCNVVVIPYGDTPEAEKKDGFTVKAPEIISIDPNQASADGQINISGNYFGSGKGGKVYLGYTNVKNGKYTKKSCSIVSWSDDEIIFMIPTLPIGDYDVIVTNSVGSAQYSQKFNIK